MRKLLTTTFLIIWIHGLSIAQSPECDCYTVQGLRIISIDSMELILTNSCSNNVYLNLFVISGISPYDTLARQAINNAAILPLNTNVSNFLHTNLISAPPFGTYRVSLTNGTLICDSIHFSPIMKIDDTQSDSPMIIYPNPFNSEFTLHLNSTQPFQFTLYNSLGEKIISKYLTDKTSIIDLSGYSKGIYFYNTIERNNKSTTGKIIKF